MRPYRIELVTLLETPAERVWDEVLRPQLLRYVAAPLVTFIPVERASWPETWEEGDYVCEVNLFGLVPMGQQRIGIRRLERAGADAPYTLVDDGASRLFRRWHHTITVTPRGPSRSRYEDVVEVEAGPLTPFVVPFVRLFYAHRQRRWRRLVQAGFRYPEERQDR